MDVPIRIAIVNQATGGGATIAARDIVSWGPSRGFDVRYFPASGESSTQDIDRELAAFKPAIVHAHCWYNTYDANFLARTSQNSLTVFTAHDTAVVNQFGEECWECYRNPFCLGCPALGPIRRWRPNYRVLARIKKRRLNRSARVHVIYPSAWMKKRLARSEWGAKPSSIIPYGIDPLVFGQGHSKRREFGLDDGPVVLFVGNMYGAEDQRKGLPDLLTAWKRVRDREPRATLCIAGKVEGLVETPGVRALAELPRERLVDLYATSDVFCLPTRGDNSPVAVLEAMASRLPVLATSVGGIPEQIEHGVSGLLVPARDPAALATAVCELIAHPELRRNLGQAARARVEVIFGKEVSASAHDSLYRALLCGDAVVG